MFTWLQGDALPPHLSPPRFRVVATSAEPCRVVMRVYGELDLLTAPQLADILDARLDSSPDGARFTVNLSGVGFMSAQGIRTLLHVARHAEARRCEFRVVGCQPVVLRVIDITASRASLHVAADN